MCSRMISMSFLRGGGLGGVLGMLTWLPNKISGMWHNTLGGSQWLTERPCGLCGNLFARGLYRFLLCLQIKPLCRYRCLRKTSTNLEKQLTKTKEKHIAKPARSFGKPLYLATEGFEKDYLICPPIVYWYRP